MRAFTLIETLVALCVLAIIVSFVSPLINTNINEYNSKKLIITLKEELAVYQYAMILNPELVIKEFELSSCDLQKISIAAGGDVKEKNIKCSFGEFEVDRFAKIYSK